MLDVWWGLKYLLICFVIFVFFQFNSFAKVHFQCGIYQVHGKLFLSGAIDKSDSLVLQNQVEDSESKKRMPMLILWQNQISETRIPMIVSKSLYHQLKKIDAEPLVAIFKIRLNQSGVSPSYGELISYKYLSIKGLTEKKMQFKLLIKEDCAVL